MDQLRFLRSRIRRYADTPVRRHVSLTLASLEVPFWSSMKSVVFTLAAPRPIGPYSQAISIEKLVFCSGQGPLDPATGDVVRGDIAVQTERTLRNLQTVLEAAGLGLQHVVKTTVFLTDLGDFPAMNNVYQSFFSENPPARSTVEVSALPKQTEVEIEAIAVRP